MDDVVVLQDVSRRFRTDRGEVVGLDEVSLRVGRGQFVAVMGATGSGKSTLLQCAAGLDLPTSGTVHLAGVELGQLGERARTRLRRDRVGFVFQTYNLLSELTAEQNVLLPQRLGAPRARSGAEVLTAVGLLAEASRPVGQLSGGQRQRVAVARALSTDPAVVFADEPTGALDPTTGASVLGLLRSAVDDRAVTVVMVTHDPVAAAWSDRLVLLRSGRVVEDGDTPGAAEIAERLRAASAPGPVSAAR